MKPIRRYHQQATKPSDGSRRARSETALLFALPLAAGVAVAGAILIGAPLRMNLSGVLTALAVLVGAMMTTFVFLANLRVKMDGTPKWEYRRAAHKLVAGLVASALYAAMFALLLLGLCLLVTSVGWLRVGIPRAVSAGVLVSIATYLGVTLLTIIRRMFAVYFELFQADYSPDLRAVREHPGAGVRERTTRKRA